MKPAILQIHDILKALPKSRRPETGEDQMFYHLFSKRNKMKRKKYLANKARAITKRFA